MSNDVITLKAYQKKCTRCGNQILMSPTGTPDHKWLALEVQSKDPHKCITNKTDEITTTKTVENGNLVAHQHTNDEKIFALEKRVSSMESWIKKVSESAVMNL